jgi:hypothetical protein
MYSSTIRSGQIGGKLFIASEFINSPPRRSAISPFSDAEFALVPLGPGWYYPPRLSWRRARPCAVFDAMAGSVRGE